MRKVGFDQSPTVTKLALATTLLFATTFAIRADTLYAANVGNNSIDRFRSAGVGTLFADSGLLNPYGLAFDSAGNLYLANNTGGRITRFTPGGASSIFAETGASGIFGMAFDAAGNLYVANG